MLSSKLSSAELLKYADEHILYEIDMLNATTIFNPSSIQVLINMRVESFGIHLRNLIDFFYNNIPQPDDMVAAHFFSDETIKAMPLPIISESLKKAKVRVNKELSHLTTERIYGYSSEKEWDFFGLTRDINALLKNFCISGTS